MNLLHMDGVQTVFLSRNVPPWGPLHVYDRCAISWISHRDTYFNGMIVRLDSWRFRKLAPNFRVPLKETRWQYNTKYNITDIPLNQCSRFNACFNGMSANLSMWRFLTMLSRLKTWRIYENILSNEKTITHFPFAPGLYVSRLHDEYNRGYSSL